MIIDEELYLEHFGKKGMRWGVRKAKRGDWKTRSASQKTGLVVGGYAGSVVGQIAGQKIARRILKDLSSSNKLAAASAITLSSTIIGGGYGVRLTRNLLQKNGKKSYKQSQRQFERSLKKDERY